MTLVELEDGEQPLFSLEVDGPQINLVRLTVTTMTKREAKRREDRCYVAR